MMKRIALLLALAMAARVAHAADNELTKEEKDAGWVLLFDGKTLDGWMTSGQQPIKNKVEEGAINPHGAGDYMVIHKDQRADFVLSLDFKLSKDCNSGVFLRTFPLTVEPGKDVGWNGIEVQVLDSTTADMHDAGAIYDLVKPARNALKPLGEWNRMVVTCHKNLIQVVLNGELVSLMDLDEWTKPGERPDGSKHKFDGIAYKNHPRKGYIGLQDHGSPCWYKNIKIRPLK